MMGYVYAAVWLLIAVYLFYTAIRRERTPILFILGGFMVFLSVWELIDVMSDINMKTGTYGWIYRGVALLALIACFVWFFRSRRGR